MIYRSSTRLSKRKAGDEFIMDDDPDVSQDEIALPSSRSPVKATSILKQQMKGSNLSDNLGHKRARGVSNMTAQSQVIENERVGRLKHAYNEQESRWAELLEPSAQSTHPAEIEDTSVALDVSIGDCDILTVAASECW
ncbi:hypothetical protein BSLG_005921 [Batrachochytrium salamandrivorans]|nr:hypothetical protein BSLG_005921 [Batrachochytrium salamandrivorans]